MLHDASMMSDDAHDVTCNLLESRLKEFLSSTKSASQSKRHKSSSNHEVIN